MSNCKGCAQRRNKFKDWFRTKMKIAGSEGTRHLITRLQRIEDSHYQELRTEIDVLRQIVAKLSGDVDKIWEWEESTKKRA